MDDDILIGLTAIIGLGISAQWLAWRFQLPSVVLLLGIGFIAGPVTKIIEPDELFGDLLLPIISISVAVILFEGGLSLRVSDLRKTGHVIRNLVIIGSLITWLSSSLIAYYILDLDFDMAVLLGAILIVSGPTVIIPILRHVRPFRRIESILKWEAIIIDPVGAMLAVLVFEAVLRGHLEDAGFEIAFGIVKTILVGVFIGLIGAGLLILTLRRYWIPDFLQSTVALMMVVVVYTISDLLQEESGLLGATVMGVILGNQKHISLRQVIEFKESLGILLVSGMFILLAARLQTEDFENLSWSSLMFLGILILAIRPVAVMISTLKSGLSWSERAFLMAIGPRGIVAAAVASVFALRLIEEEHTGAELLVPITFLVVMGSVISAGLLAAPLAKKLHLADPDPQGVLIVGAQPWARDIASVLQTQGVNVRLVDTNWMKLSAARNAGLSTFYASILSQYALDVIDLDGIGKLLALTPNDGTNSLAALHFAPLLGRANVYQLPPRSGTEDRKEAVSQHLRGRFAFGQDITYQQLESMFNGGATVKATGLTEVFDHAAFLEYYGDRAIPLFVISSDGGLVVFTDTEQPTLRPGDTVISILQSEPVPG